MKVIYVTGEREGDATIFEENFGDVLNLTLWNKIRNDGFLVANNDNGDDIDMEVKALEFTDVDPNFVKFIKSTLIGYEYSKTSNIFVIDESK